MTKKTRALLLSLLIVILLMSLLPIQAAQAQETTTSDLVLSLVSIPKHVKACQTFEAVYTVTNLGPDTAYNLSAGAGIPDTFDIVDIVGLPESLAVGESATFTVMVKVTLFVPGEMRLAWVNATANSTGVDPNPDNNTIRTEMKIIGKHVECPLN